jgi:hypothetical protein
MYRTLRVAEVSVSELTVNAYMGHRPYWEAKIIQLVKKVPAFYGTENFVTACVRTRLLFLAWDRWIQPTSYHPDSLIRVFQIYAYVYRVVLFLQVFQQKPCMFLPSPPYLSYAPTITSPFIWLSWCCLVSCTNYEVTYRQITGREQNRGAAERSIVLAWLRRRVACVVPLCYFSFVLLAAGDGVGSVVRFPAIGRRRFPATYSRAIDKNHACSFYFNIIR